MREDHPNLLMIVLVLPELNIAELQIQILPLIENLEWLYIWGVVVRSSDAIVRRSVGRSVGRSGDLRIGGWGIFGVW